MEKPRMYLHERLYKALEAIDEAYTNYQLLNNPDKPFNISQWRATWDTHDVWEALKNSPSSVEASDRPANE